MLKKNLKYIYLLLGGTALFATGCTNPNVALEENNKEEVIEDTGVTISAVGDIMVHGAQLEAQSIGDGKYSFDNNFKNIKNIIENSEVSIANLETTVNINKSPSGYPSFNSPKELLSALKNTGFDIISTINNHTLDTGYSGVVSTLNELKVAGLKSVGTKESANDKNYIIEDIEGIKLGIATFSYGDVSNGNKYLNGIPAGQAKDLLNVISGTNAESALETIKKEIDLMKSEGVEFIIVGLHWGIEYKQTPTEFQKKLAQMLANEGVDLILGSHPHVVQPMEFIKSEINPEDETLVVYSMGNIISNQREEEMGFKESENGIIPLVDVEEIEDGVVKIKEAKYVPTWVNKGNNGDKAFYEIIPIDDNIEEVAKKYNVSEDDLKISLENTSSLMTDERIKLYKKNV